MSIYKLDAKPIEKCGGCEILINGEWEFINVLIGIKSILIIHVADIIRVCLLVYAVVSLKSPFRSVGAVTWGRIRLMRCRFESLYRRGRMEYPGDWMNVHQAHVFQGCGNVSGIMKRFWWKCRRPHVVLWARKYNVF
jgi:hypothetical protein